MRRATDETEKLGCADNSAGGWLLGLLHQKAEDYARRGSRRFRLLSADAIEAMIAERKAACGWRLRRSRPYSR